MKKYIFIGLFLLLLPFLTKAQTKDQIPGVRAHHTLVYHAGNELAYLVGGSTRIEGGYHYYNDVWSWDGEQWEAKQEMPFPKSSHQIIHHTKRNTLILFGGGFQRAIKAEGVFWEKAEEEWKAVGGNFMAGRDEPGMCYDKARNKIVIFGGWDRSANYTSDTWEWDGSNFARVDTSGPAPRAGHMFTYDPVRESCLIFGGRGPDGYLSDMWEWNGEKWGKLEAKGPSARWFFGSAMDHANEKIVIFGGRGDGGDLNDTWVWDGEAWTQSNSKSETPMARSMGKLAYSRYGILLFGGRHSTEDGFIDLNDTWIFKNEEWSQQ